MHSRELAQCDGGEALHGEVSVRFAVDANGTVIKSQLSSTLSAPKVATCILQAVQNWQFPLQPAGGALGTYTLSFQ
jgi:TonB family protein